MLMPAFYLYPPRKPPFLQRLWMLTRLFLPVITSPRLPLTTDIQQTSSPMPPVRVLRPGKLWGFLSHANKTGLGEGREGAEGQAGGRNGNYFPRKPFAARLPLACRSAWHSWSQHLWRGSHVRNTNLSPSQPRLL